MSEGIGIKWNDIKWEKEFIVISRQWIDHAQCFAPLKGTRRLPEHKQYRIFPMPKNGRLMIDTSYKDVRLSKSTDGMKGLISQPNYPAFVQFSLKLHGHFRSNAITLSRVIAQLEGVEIQLQLFS